jgi:hypothetical protein
MLKLKILKKYLIILVIFSSFVSCDNDKDSNDTSNNTQIKTQQKPKTATDYFNLANDYYFGEGVKQDYATAIKYYEKAAELGNSTAMYNLGIIYANGQGVKQDYATTIKYYEKAAELGNVTAMYNLGIIYDNGQGVKQDYATAIKYYEKAAELGNATAMNNLGNIYKYGRGVKQDYKKAEEYYIKEANTKIAPKPFGIAINTMNLKEFLDKYEAKYIGEDDYTDGKKYVSTNLSQFNFNGLTKVTVIFNNEIISAVVAEFQKDTDSFSYLYDNLMEKDYYKISSKIPFVGDKYAKFISGSVFVELIANHLSHSVYLTYETQAYSIQRYANMLKKKFKQLEHEKDSL